MSLCSNRELLSLMKNHENEAAKLLIEKDNLYNATDPSNNTLLHFAVKYRNSEIVQYLIESGCAIDTRNNLGQTPLSKSLKPVLPCQKIVELLLVAGADVHSQDKDGTSAFDKVDNIEWLTEDITRFDILKMFLKYGDILYLDCLALLDGNKGVIKSLLQTDIDLCATDVEGKSLVHALAANGNDGVIEQLRGRNYNVDARDNDGWTALMYAAKNGNANAVEFLLKEGADVELTNPNGETSLYLAFSLYVGDNVKKTVQILLEHDANVQVQTADGEAETIFDLLSLNEELKLAEFPLAHLALQEALGTTEVTDLIRSKIDSTSHFKSFFKDCQEKLSVEICPPITLLNILTGSGRKLERYFRNEEVASKLTDFQTAIGYFDMILEKRFAKARKMVELRKIATEIVCKLIRLDYDSYPIVVDEIVSYLEEQDIECLQLIENELY